MDVNPGELNKKIEICTLNKNSGLKTTIRNCWASINNTSGSEIKRNAIEIDSVKTRFLIRYSTTEISNKHSIIYSGKVYNIVYAQDYGESHEYIEILAEYKGLKYENNTVV